MLVQKIRGDMTAAMRAKDDLRVQTLRGALAAFTNELVAKGKKPTDELGDAGATAVLKRLAKQRREASETYAKGGRADLAEKESKELAIIEEYLPKMASREEIEKVAQAKKEVLGISDPKEMGKLMGAVMKELGGNADGTLVKAIVAEIVQ